MVLGPERSLQQLRTSEVHVGLEVHQATGLCLQEVGDPLSGFLSAIPALHLQTMHSAMGTGQWAGTIQRL